MTTRTFTVAIQGMEPFPALMNGACFASPPIGFDRGW